MDVEPSLSTKAPVAYVGKYLEHLCGDESVAKDFLHNRFQPFVGEISTVSKGHFIDIYYVVLDIEVCSVFGTRRKMRETDILYICILLNC